MADRPSPLQNRMTPEGDIIAVPARGTMMGNRGGAFHDADQKLGRRHWVSRQWICCVLQFRGRHRQVMRPGRYTELFFLDEVTALAAGHRPCFECRRAAALDFASRWSGVRGLPDRAGAAAMDAVLHEERLAADRRGKRTYVASCAGLPDNTMIRVDDRFLRVAGGRLQVLNGGKPGHRMR